MDPSSLKNDITGIMPACINAAILVHINADNDPADKTRASALMKDIGILYDIFNSIEPLLTSNVFPGARNGAALQASLQSCISDCGITLATIQETLKSPSSFERSGVFRKATPTEKATETQFFYQQVTLHHTALTLASQAIKLCNASQNIPKQDVSQRLKDFKAQISKAMEAIALHQQTTIPNTLTTVTTGHSRAPSNLYKLALQAEALRASVIVDTNASSTRSKSLPHDLSTAPTSSSPDSSLEMEKKLLKQFIQLGDENLRLHEYQKAETCFFEANELFRICNETPDPEALDDLQSRLALAYCAQAKWHLAELILFPMLDSERILDLLATHCLHALAMGLLYIGQLETAERACRGALQWKEKKFGKDYRSYLVTAEILARICHTKGLRDEADSWRVLLPKSLWLHGNNAWELYLTMSCPELDTVSTDSNGRSVEGTSYVTKWGGYRSGDPPITDGLTEAAHPNFSPSLSPSSSKSARLGNENEGFTKLCKFSAKLFIFRRTDHTWGFHGAGEVVLVKYKSNGVTRLMMRKDKSLKLIMDHRVDPSTKISLNTTSDRSWVFNAKDDVAEGTPRDLTLALRFENSEKAELFKKAFVKAQESNAEVLVPGGGVGG